MVQNCISWCNTNTTDNSELAACGFFNFESGKSRTRLTSQKESHRWQESRCYYALIGVYSGTESRVELVPDEDFDHFSQICVRKETGDILRSLCPNRLYTFNRIPNVKFKPPGAKSLSVQSREECQDRCLSEKDFQCRAASYESSQSMCHLSDLTKEMAPKFCSKDDDFEYMENTCVTGDSKCKGISHFVHEDSKELSNPKDAMAMPEGTSRDQCRRICRDDKGLLPFYCKSFHYAQDLQLCLLSEHDTSSDQIEAANSTVFSYSEATCVQGGTYFEIQCSFLKIKIHYR